MPNNNTLADLLRTKLKTVDEEAEHAYRYIGRTQLGPAIGCILEIRKNLREICNLDEESEG